jgi:hypothetical protein
VDEICQRLLDTGHTVNIAIQRQVLLGRRCHTEGRTVRYSVLYWEASIGSQCPLLR